MALKDVMSAGKPADNKAGTSVPESMQPAAHATEMNPGQVVLAQSKEDLFLRQLMAESQQEPEAWNLKAGELMLAEQFKSMFELPVELRKGTRQASQAKDRSYCWVEVSDERIARMYTRDGWLPVNRTNHAFLPTYYFSIHGGLERNGYSRHILFYQPKAYNEAIKMAAVKRGQDRLEENRKKLENTSGPVRLEEVTTSGGYGITPGDDPIQTDWQGNRTEYSPGE